MAARNAVSTSSTSLWLWLGLAAIVILADQVSKTLIVGWFQLGDSRPVTSFFDIVRAHNKGAAFSFLHDAAGWQRWFFIGLGLAASAFIVWMMRSHPTQKLFCFAVAMIMGGALGNVIDRVIHGYVVDFLLFHGSIFKPIFQGGYFPAFNIADSAISLGAVCLILDEVLRVRRGR
jgi:signal peptidase II